MTTEHKLCRRSSSGSREVVHFVVSWTSSCKRRLSFQTSKKRSGVTSLLTRLRTCTACAWSTETSSQPTCWWETRTRSNWLILGSAVRSISKNLVSKALSSLQHRSMLNMLWTPQNDNEEAKLSGEASQCWFALVICMHRWPLLWLPHIQVANAAFVGRILVRSCGSVPLFWAKLVGTRQPTTKETATRAQHFGARRQGQGHDQRPGGSAGTQTDRATTMQNAGLQPEEAASCTGLFVWASWNLSWRVALEESLMAENNWRFKWVEFFFRIRSLGFTWTVKITHARSAMILVSEVVDYDERMHRGDITTVGNTAVCKV